MAVAQAVRLALLLLAVRLDRSRRTAPLQPLALLEGVVQAGKGSLPLAQQPAALASGSLCRQLALGQLGLQPLPALPLPLLQAQLGRPAFAPLVEAAQAALEHPELVQGSLWASADQAAPVQG